jgi:MFS family permease
MALYFMPNLVVGPWAGVLTDRIDKRRLLLVSQSAMMVAALALGVLVLAGAATLPLVVLLAGLTGVAFAFDRPARRTIVTELVDDDAAANAASLNGGVGQGAKLVGRR